MKISQNNFKLMYKNHPQIVDFAARNLDDVLYDLKLFEERILFVSDQKIWQKNVKFFGKNLPNLVSEILLLDEPKADEKTLKKLRKKAEKFELIIAFGSGTINDLCKATSAQNNTPYIVIPSAASMNGYLSKNASITISNHKKTIAATLPKAVLIDLEILKNAPLELTKAGIGDSFSFYSCWFDWFLSNQILGTKFDEKCFTILQPKIDFLRKNYAKFSLRDEKLLEALIEILLLSGLAMTRAEGSYPASQSEHLISHAIEMKFEKTAKNLHGAQIAVTTLTSAKIQEKLLQKKSLKIAVENFPQKEIEKFFDKKIALQCRSEFLQKQKLIAKVEVKNWSKIREKLRKIHMTESELQKLFQHFKIKSSARSLQLTTAQYQTCIHHAKFIRNRFTCLDLATIIS